MILADEAATQAFGAALATALRPGDVVTLCGPLGAGKTTLARGLVHALDEILGHGALIVEWPERAPGAWPHALALSLEPLDSAGRRLTAKVPPSWEERWPLPHFPA
jgi:tRNA threonylcarbamoyladenosine biosynthesis protein TsaE